MAERALNKQVVDLLNELNVPTSMQSRIDEVCAKLLKKTTILDSTDEKIVEKIQGLLDRVVPETGRFENPYRQLATTKNIQLKHAFLKQLEAGKKLEMRNTLSRSKR